MADESVSLLLLRNHPENGYARNKMFGFWENSLQERLRPWELLTNYRVKCFPGILCARGATMRDSPLSISFVQCPILDSVHDESVCVVWLCGKVPLLAVYQFLDRIYSI